MTPTRHRSSVFILGITLFTLATAWAPPARSAPQLDSVCGPATARVAAETGIPQEVLAAITLTETGRQSDGVTSTWPWTVNSEGKGFWFDTRDEALRFVRSELAQGTTSFDVGCFQINYRWHGDNFSSVEEMFDPIANARYAAKFLGDLYNEFGDWSLAAGAYHSRTQVYATRYRGRFDRLRAALGDGDLPAGFASVQPPSEPRVNNFPLLMAAGGGRTSGSLVPLGAGGGGRLIPLNSTWAIR